MAKRSKSKYMGFNQEGYVVIDRCVYKRGQMIYRVVNNELNIDFWVSGAALRKVVLKKTTLAKIYYYKTNYRTKNYKENGMHY